MDNYPGENGSCVSNKTLISGNATLFSQRLIIWASVQFLRCGIDTVLSLLIIVTFARYKRLNNGTNFILCNLAFANLLMDIVFALGALVMLLRPHIHVPRTWCVAQSFLLLTFTFSSLMLLSMISVYQILSVIFPAFHRRITTVHLVAFFTLPCWLYPVPTGLLTVAGVLGEYDARAPYGNYCEFGRKNHRVATLVVVFVNVLVPNLILFFSNFGIFYKILRARWIVAPESVVDINIKLKTIPQQGNLERQARLLWTVFVPSAVFFIFFYVAFGANRDTRSWFDNDPLVYLWVKMLEHSSTSLVAVIYALANRDFREGFRFLFQGRKLRPLPRSHGRIAAMSRTQAA